MKRLMIASVLAFTAAFAMPVMAEDHGEGAEHEEIDHFDEFQGYLKVSEGFVNLANRKDAAVFFAIEGIIEIHEEKGQPAEAIAALRSVLDSYPQTAETLPFRNIIRFQLRDLYLENDQPDLALAELQAILTDNR